MEAVGVNVAFLVAQIINFLILFLLLAVIIGAVVWIARQLRGVSGPQEEPLGILKRRLAAGEIDEETYERLRRKIIDG